MELLRVTGAIVKLEDQRLKEGDWPYTEGFFMYTKF